MEYARLGNSDIEVSKLCLGCMSFGDPASNMHAWTLSPGESEKNYQTCSRSGHKLFRYGQQLFGRYE